MPRPTKDANGHPIESYAHPDKERLNNPPIGLVTPDTDPDAGPKTYQYDPHLDPQLVWAGKAEPEEPLPDLVLNAYYLLGYDWR